VLVVYGVDSADLSQSIVGNGRCTADLGVVHKGPLSGAQYKKKPGAVTPGRPVGLTAPENDGVPLPERTGRAYRARKVLLQLGAQGSTIEPYAERRVSCCYDSGNRQLAGKQDATGSPSQNAREDTAERRGAGNGPASGRALIEEGTADTTCGSCHRGSFVSNYATPTSLIERGVRL